MACVGRTKECTIVPANHFGPIPGVPVGTMWRFRVQVSADPTGFQILLLSLCLNMVGVGNAAEWGQEDACLREGARLGHDPLPCHGQLCYGSWTQPLG